MIDRFDNVSTADLASEVRTLRADLGAHEAALKRRLVAECGVMVDRSYVIKRGLFGGYLQGRRMWVRCIRAEMSHIGKSAGEYFAVAEGILLRPRPDPKRRGFMDGRYTSKHCIVFASALDLSTESEP